MLFSDYFKTVHFLSFGHAFHHGKLLISKISSTLGLCLHNCCFVDGLADDSTIYDCNHFGVVYQRGYYFVLITSRKACIVIAYRQLQVPAITSG